MAVSERIQYHESPAEFARWALRELECEVASAEGMCQVSIPPARVEEFGGRDAFQFACETNGATADAAIPVSDIPAEDRLTLDSPLMKHLLTALQAAGNVAHAQPSRQPVSVHELTGRLFAAYTVDGGGVYLGGCTLEDQPFLRLTYRGAEDTLTHYYFAGDGVAADDETIAELGLDRVAPYGAAPPRIAEADTHRLLTMAKTHVARAHQQTDAPLAAALIWCKYAEGKLAFHIGDASTEVAFSGWARTLAAPPVVCPATGIESYHVVATDEAQITVAEALGKCELSGRSVRVTDLVECAATGKRVLEKFVEVCPVTGQHVIEAELVRCKTCQQRVSPKALSGGACKACRGVRPVTKDDPPMARLLGEFPGLDRWKRWRMSETATVYIAIGSTLMRQLLLVVDKDTLEPLHLATRGRVLRGWTAVPDAGRDELLR